MLAVKLRNLKLEDEYFKILAVWRKAAKDDSYTENDLKMIFTNLERAFKAVGYCFGDRDQDAVYSNKNAPPFNLKLKNEQR